MPKPIPAKPPGVNTICGPGASQYCSTHVWWLPVSVIISVSGEAAARSSLIARRGSIGTSFEAFSCSMKFDHSVL